MIVSSFGIHEDQDHIRWLLQNGEPVNAVGLKSKPDLKVERRRCNHQIDLERPAPSAAEWSVFNELRLEYEIVELMLPIPRRRRGVFECWGEDMYGLIRLVRMSAPIRDIPLHMWNVNRKEVYDDLQASNIQPYVVIGVKPEDSVFIQEVGRYGKDMPRPFFYMPAEPGFRTPATVTKVFAPTVPELNWEAIGAEVVRRYMRGQGFNA